LPEAFLHKFQDRFVLSPEERAGFLRVFGRERRFEMRQDLVASGSSLSYSNMIVDGLAARYKLLSNGRRQFTAIHVAGDFADLQSFLLHRMEYGVTALTPCTAVTADHEALQRLIEESGNIQRLLWMDTMLEASIHQEWVVSMGRRSAVGRLAHLMCELFMRLKLVRRTDDLSFKLPLTQLELADVLGLSIVHVNRVLSELRRERLLTWTNHVIRIEDWEKLAEVAEFQPDYLSVHIL